MLWVGEGAAAPQTTSSAKSHCSCALSRSAVSVDGLPRACLSLSVSWPVCFFGCGFCGGAGAALVVPCGLSPQVLSCV